MKKFVCGFVLGGLLFTSVPVFAQGLYKTVSVKENSINLFINGNRINEKNYIINNTTFVPIRVVSEALGQKVNYDKSSNSVRIGEQIKSYKDMSLGEKISTIKNNLKLRRTYTQNGGYYEEWEFNINVLYIFKTMTTEEKKSFFETETINLATKTNANSYWFRFVDEDGGLLYCGFYNKTLGFKLI